MILLKKLTLALSVTLLMFLQGCGNNSSDPDEPGAVAIEFFDAIYNQQNLDSAVKLSTPQYSRILQSYYTVERVQKVLFNRRYDQVEIEEDTSMSDLSIRGSHGEKAYITLMLDGQFNGERFRDLKQVVMVKQQGKWKVDKLKADVYR